MSRGPTPKPAHLRQRRNKESTRATLPSPEESAGNVVPLLMEREEPWHPQVLRWWKSVWTSPMASEFLDSDVEGGLYALAQLWQNFWDAEPKHQTAILTEIRQQGVCFGLTPIDRRRLQWEVERGEAAEDRTRKRKQRARPAESGEDPRTSIGLVS